MSLRTCLVGILLCLQLSGLAQEVSKENGENSQPGKTSLNGYFSDLLSPQYNNFLDQWKTTNYLNQRLNFNWTPSGHFRLPHSLEAELFITRLARIQPI